MKLKKAAQTTATRGLRTRVDTTVAMELAASWKPFMKSKARATRTMKGTIPSWFKKLDCFSFQSSRPPDQDFASFRIFDLPPRGRATGDLGPGVPPGRECCVGRAQPTAGTDRLRGEALSFHRPVWTSRRGIRSRLPRPVRTPTGLSDTGQTGSPQSQGQLLEVMPDGRNTLPAASGQARCAQAAFSPAASGRP